MAKVMTSENGVLSTEVIVDKPKRPPGAAPAVEMKAGDGVAPPVVEAPEVKAGEKSAEAPKTEDPVLEAEDHDLPERARRRIGKYSVAAKQEAALRAAAESEAAESERFAEQLFNEREQWRKRAEAAEAKAPKEQAKAPESIKPNPEDPKYKNEKGEFQWLAFSDDNAAYAAKQAIAEDRKAQAEAQAQAQQKAQEAEFAKRIDVAIKKNPDWREVVGNSPIELQNEALAYIAQSEYGTDIAYFLAKHPEDAARIKALHPIRAIAELGKIETGFEKPAESPAIAAATSKTVERPGAPAPITPISTSGSGSIVIDPAKMDFKQLRAYERERRKSRR